MDVYDMEDRKKSEQWNKGYKQGWKEGTDIGFNGGVWTVLILEFIVTILLVIGWLGSTFVW